MKYAVCQEMFVDWEWKKQCEFIAKTGYTGVEIAPFTIASHVAEISPEQRKEIRTTAEDAGLEVVGLHWLLAKTEGFYLTTDDEKVRETTGDYFSQLANLCGDVGGSLMVLGSPQQRNLLPGMSVEKATENAIDTLKRCLPALEKNNVVMCIEPLGRTETDFCNTCESAVEMMREIDHPLVRLHQDVKAMLDEPTEIPDLIHQFSNEVGHFHVNDGNLLGPGMGETDYLPILKALQDTNYDGWLSLEVFDYTPGCEHIAQESLRYLKETMSKL